MINIKKILFFIIKSIFTLVILLTLVLFFYAAFFYKPSSVERKTEENKITKMEEPSTLESKKIPENDVEKFEDVIVTPKIEAVIKDSLFATVGNKALTRSDIVNELKMILILSNQRFSEDRRQQLETAAVKSVIRRTIKRIEIEKYKSLTYSQKDLDKELNRLVSNLNMDLDKLKSTLLANKIDFMLLVNKIQTELLWNSLIFELYKNKISINIKEIDEQLKLIQNKKETYEYLISEIIIKAVPKDQLKAKIKEVKNKINTEGFEKVAVDFSISETSIRGGDLGWINENVLSNKLKSKIVSTSVGNISEPTMLPEGILFFKVRDKRKLKKLTNLEDAKNQLVNAEKTKILNMHSMSHYDSVQRSISIQYY